MGIQSFGTGFELTKLFAAREFARELAYELSSHIRPGMTEDKAHQIYKELAQKKGVTKQWHPPKIRFGPNTTKNFSDVSDPYVLQEEDIFFVDIGPVLDGHEADYGETFTVGNNFDQKHLADCSRKVFKEVTAEWKANRTTGMVLYEFADSRAKKYGYTLNGGMDGHRLGDFPHQVHFKGGLAEVEEHVIPNAWILEIHLWSPGKRMGAFFEDILTDQEL